MNFSEGKKYKTNQRSETVKNNLLDGLSSCGVICSVKSASFLRLEVLQLKRLEVSDS